MRRYLPFILISASLFMVVMSGCGSNRPETPEAIAEELVKALNNKDESAFQHLLLSEEAMGRILERSRMEEDERAERRKSLNKEYNEEFKPEAKEKWAQALSVLEGAGMSTGELKIAKMEMEREIRGNVEGAEVTLTLEGASSEIQLFFVAVEDGGWWLLPGLELRPA